jgi:hypothetical protein
MEPFLFLRNSFLLEVSFLYELAQIELSLYVIEINTFLVGVYLTNNSA